MRPVLADAAEVARRALVELEPDGVGVHLGVTAEDETAATHRFEATLAGYRGWQWAVVVAAPPEATYATVSESALLPGPDALIAPDFVPWEQRVRPGDLGPGDLLAPPADDPRLVPGYVATGDPVIDEVAREVGLGRTQVLSLEGRLEAAERWYAEFGPDTEMAKAAPSTCGLCGFYLPLAGALRESFGVCGNAMGADGHVVHIEYGCGAHSDVVAPSGNGSPRYEAFDDHAVDYVEVTRTEPAATVEVNGSAEGGAAGNASAETATESGSAATQETAEAAAKPERAAAAGAQETAEAAATPDTAEVAAAQETAEAEAVEAAAADRAALAEGAQPESAAEVIAAESTATEAGTSATEAGSAIDVPQPAAETPATPAVDTTEAAPSATNADANGTQGADAPATPATSAAADGTAPAETADVASSDAESAARTTAAEVASSNVVAPETAEAAPAPGAVDTHSAAEVRGSSSGLDDAVNGADAVARDDDGESVDERGSSVAR